MYKKCRLGDKLFNFVCIIIKKTVFIMIVDSVGEPRSACFRNSAILKYDELLAVVRKDIYIVCRAWHSRILYLSFIKKRMQDSKSHMYLQDILCT